MKKDVNETVEDEEGANGLKLSFFHSLSKMRFLCPGTLWGSAGWRPQLLPLVYYKEFTARGGHEGDETGRK